MKYLLGAYYGILIGLTYVATWFHWTPNWEVVGMVLGLSVVIHGIFILFDYQPL